MNCRKVNSLLSAYLDGELTGVEQIQVRQHLRACSECDEEYESLLLTKRMLATLAVREPDSDFENRILARLSDQEAGHTGFNFLSWWSVLSQPDRHRVRLAGLCTTLSVAALCFSLSHPVPSSGPVGREVAAGAPAPTLGGAMVAPAQSAREDREYLYVHSPYAWDDSQPMGGPSISPASSYSVPTPAMHGSALFGQR